MPSDLPTAVVVVLLAIGLYAGLNVLREYNERGSTAENAAERTTQGLMAVVLGGVTVLFTVATEIVNAIGTAGGELAQFVGEIGSLLGSIPGVLSHLILIGVGWASMVGEISIPPIVWVGLGGALLIAVVMIRNS